MKNIIYVLLLLILVTGCESAKQLIPWPQKKTEIEVMLDNAWKSLNNNAHEETLNITSRCVDSYSEEAKMINEQCAQMMNTPDDYGRCSMLDVVSQCVFIRFETFRKMKDLEKMNSDCDELNKFYYNAFVWDPKGWPWKPAEACKEIIQQEKNAS